MLRRWTALTLLSLVAATGCAASSDGPAASDRATTLWAARTPHVGDNSRVDALVGIVGPAPQGSYTISLQTAQKPYGLTLSMDSLQKPFELLSFDEPATLLLGLVANLDEVSITSHGKAYSLTTAEASKDLGYDVKELGRDQRKLTAYVTAAAD